MAHPIRWLISRRYLITTLIFISSLFIFFLPSQSIATTSLKLASWNLENLTLSADKDFATLRNYLTQIDADIIALQEVDGPGAARLVFNPDQYNFYFADSDDDQKTGFAIRRELTVSQNPDYMALDVGNVRPGADITVQLGEQQIRMLSVHLKSFCFSDPLDGDVSADSDCSVLKAQLPILEKWIDARACEGVPFAVLGDFNRRLNISGDDFWAEIDDGKPRNSDLIKVTEGARPTCFGGQYPEFIDHIVLDRLSGAWFVPGSFQEWDYQQPLSQQDQLSDHCAISAVLDTSQPLPQQSSNLFGGISQFISCRFS
jgi:exonuclease III